MTNQEAKNLLDRYHKGECTPEEKTKLEAWYDMLAQQGTPEWKEGERAQIKDELKDAIDAQINNQKGRIISLRLIWVAASIIFICCFGFLVIKYKDPLRDRFYPVVYMETVVPAGGKEKLTLSDGSTVILNGASRIRYPESFNRKIREVSLIEGEAFFDIKHDESKPFVVKAMGTKINVLGTAFNVRAYKFLRDIQITVSRGKVSVSSMANVKHEKAGTITLLPNEQVTIGKINGEIIKKHINSDDFTGWVQGKYRFDNETLGNVASMLESYYKVRVTFANDDLKDIRFSSEFESTDKLEDLLFTICKANNLSYTINDQHIILSARNNQQIK
jgi:transmembrane sensor